MADSRNVELTKFDERWITFLMREYIRHTEFNIEKAKKEGHTAGTEIALIEQIEWMRDYANQRNRETCEDLGIDLAELDKR